MSISSDKKEMTKLYGKNNESFEVFLYLDKDLRKDKVVR